MNIKENILNEFNEKVITFLKPKEQNYEKNKLNKNNNLCYYEYNPISIEIINN